MKMYIWSQNLFLLLVWTLTSAENAGKGLVIVDPTVDSLECHSCPPGFAVSRLCDSTQKTECTECPNGTFNIYHTRNFTCDPCSTCSEGYYERVPCSPIQDAVCEACEDSTQELGGGYGNEDFLRKCEKSTTTTTPLSTTTIAAPSQNTQSQPKTTHINKELPEGDDLAKFITVANSSFIPGAEESSGEGSGEVGPTLKVVTVGSVGVIKEMDNIPSEQTTESIIPVGEIIKEPEVTESSLKIWPIILVLIIAAVVCITVGCIVVARKKKAKGSHDVSPTRKPPKGQTDVESPCIQVPMIQNGTEPRKTPLNNGTTPEERTLLTGSKTSLPK